MDAENGEKEQCPNCKQRSLVWDEYWPNKVCPLCGFVGRKRSDAPNISEFELSELKDAESWTWEVDFAEFEAMRINHDLTYSELENLLFYASDLGKTEANRLFGEKDYSELLRLARQAGGEGKIPQGSDRVPPQLQREFEDRARRLVGEKSRFYRLRKAEPPKVDDLVSRMVRSYETAFRMEWAKLYMRGIRTSLMEGDKFHGR